MLSLLISLLFLVVIFGFIWWIITMIPFPAELVWVVRVVFAVLFLFAVISLITGGWAFPFAHHAWR